MTFLLTGTLSPTLANAAASVRSAELQAVDCFNSALRALSATCFTAKTPENYDVPIGRQVEFPVAVIKGDKGGDPVFYFPGGPGRSVLDDENVLRLLESSAGGRDLVVFAYRGSRRANPELDCDPSYDNLLIFWSDFSPTVYTNGDTAKGLSFLTTYLETCHDKLIREGIDLKQYTEYQIALDIEALRKALDYSAIHAVGHTAGASSAFTQAQLFPDTVVSIIAESPWLRWTRNRSPIDEFGAARIVFTQLLAPYAGKNFEGHVFSLFDIGRARRALDEKPFKFVLNGRQADFDGAALMQRLYMNLPGDLETLAALLAATADGDRSGLKDFIGQPRVRGEKKADKQGSLPWGLHFALPCGSMGADKLTKSEALAIVEMEPALLGFEPNIACPWWETRGDVPADFDRPPSLDIPVLVVTGKRDTCCGLRTVHDIMLVTPFVQSVSLRERGAWVLGECRNHLVRQFLDDPREAIDSSCAF
ncbi:MAG: alpha/beta fold hydrolase [Pseudomonadota bacterium]